MGRSSRSTSTPVGEYSIGYAVTVEAAAVRIGVCSVELNLPAGPDRSIFEGLGRSSRFSNPQRLHHKPPQGVERRVALQAKEQTAAMIRWWHEIAAVEHVDIAVRRSGGEMIWHHDQHLSRLPLPWMRAENAGGADVYWRPARGHAWPLVFLDDVERRLALRIAGKYDCAVVETSPPGGCHVWLRCSRPLTEAERRRAQRWLVARTGADPGSVSGAHLGRLAGLKNWKRQGCWVNVRALTVNCPPWDPQVVPRIDETEGRSRRGRDTPRRSGRDLSPSGRDWGWVCSQLERGVDSGDVTRRLIARAEPRRGADAARYARQTIQKATRHVANVDFSGA